MDFTLIDQLDKDGKIIGQYANVTRVTKTETQTLNKDELIKQRDKLLETAYELDAIIQGMR